MTFVTLAGKPFNYYCEGSGVPVINICGSESGSEGRGIDARNTGIPNFKNTDLVNSRFQLISYDTPSWSTSNVYVTVASGGEDVNRSANECFLLLQYLNLPKVQVFAHRQVGYVALKLALDHPDLVNSIAFLNFEIVNSHLFNPKMQRAMSMMMQRRQNDPQYRQRIEMMRQMIEAAKTGTTSDGEPVDPEIAAQLNSIPREFLERFKATADSTDPFLATVKGYATQMLSTSYEETVSRIKSPILAAVWEDGEEWARESAVQLRGWLPQTEIYTVPKKSHWYSGQNDKGLAEGLAEFYSRHPLQ